MEGRKEGGRDEGRKNRREEGRSEEQKEGREDGFGDQPLACT